MKIDKAREMIKTLQEYVAAYESYDPKDMKQEAIKLYAELENVGKIAKELNERGYRKDGKPVAGKIAKVKLNSNDVTTMLDTKPNEDDQLHVIVRKTLNRNRVKRA